MKEPQLVQDYLQDILEAMDKAEEFVGALDLRAFSKDNKTAFAVIRCIEIVGEAAKKIPPLSGGGLSIFRGRVWPECGIN
jgi:uncharacterized protein with HEPN domain